MTNQEAKILINKTMPKGNSAIDIQLRGALELAMNALGAIEQLTWERDIALEQLGELGISFGEKIDHIKELIEKNKGKEAVDKSKNPTDWHVMHCPNCDRIFWNSGQFVHYEPEFCEKCGQKINWSDRHLTYNVKCQ